MPARKCPHCKVVSNFTNKYSQVQVREEDRRLNIEECQSCQKSSYFEVHSNDAAKILYVYPSVEVDIDVSLPDDVKPALQEAYQNLETKTWNSCVVMSRRALEEAVKDLGASGNRLIDKIDDLAKNQTITPDLKEWAHEARLGGNLGAHGSGSKKWADEEDAEEIIEFVKWFLRYTYVLPSQLAERRGRVSGSGAGGSSP